MAIEQESGIECEALINSISNFPSLILDPACTSLKFSVESLCSENLFFIKPRVSFVA